MSNEHAVVDRRGAAGKGGVFFFASILHTPQYSRRAPGPTEAEAPRGVLKRLMRKVSKLVTPAALESLPRLVAALCGSEYLYEVMEAVQEAYYQNHPKPSDPEEEEYWRFEIPHTIS